MQNFHAVCLLHLNCDYIQSAITAMSERVSHASRRKTNNYDQTLQLEFLICKDGIIHKAISKNKRKVNASGICHQ